MISRSQCLSRGVFFCFCCANYTRKWYDLSGRSYGENLPAVGTNLQEFFGRFSRGSSARSVSEFDSQREERKGVVGALFLDFPQIWKKNCERFAPPAVGSFPSLRATTTTTTTSTPRCDSATQKFRRLAGSCRSRGRDQMRSLLIKIGQRKLCPSPSNELNVFSG